MSLMLGSRIRSSSPSPPFLEFVAAANLLLEFVCYLQFMACPRHFCVAD